MNTAFSLLLIVGTIVMLSAIFQSGKDILGGFFDTDEPEPTRATAAIEPLEPVAPAARRA